MSNVSKRPNVSSVTSKDSAQSVIGHRRPDKSNPTSELSPPPPGKTYPSQTAAEEAETAGFGMLSASGDGTIHTGFASGHYPRSDDVKVTGAHREPPMTGAGSANVTASTIAGSATRNSLSSLLVSVHQESVL